jgi:hypothetical protein
MSSRSVSLTSTFLLLAAGGTAACDNGDKYHDEGFYCADANGVVVDEDYCDDTSNRYYGGGGGGGFFIWHSSGYRSGYPVGYRLPSGGNKFAYNDRAARSSFGLPSSGRIGNGTVKTSVVGKGGSGTSGKSGTSGSKSGS